MCVKNLEKFVNPTYLGHLIPEFSVTPAWVNTATETDKKCGLSPKYNSYDDYFKVTPDSYDLA